MTPRGRVNQIELDANSATYTTDADTDFEILNQPLLGGRLYGIELQSHLTYATVDATAAWQINLEIDSVVVDRFGSLLFPLGTYRFPFKWEYLFECPADADYDFLISVDEIVNGAQLQFVGGGPPYRRLTIWDRGGL
jgi:hypothetical protein